MAEKRYKTVKVWVSGDTLVRAWGEQEANDELYGDGFPAKLSRFIAERDKALKAEEEARRMRAAKRASVKARASQVEEEEMER